MLHVLRRHPVPIEAHFEWVLVLTYALPEAALRPLLSPGLVLDVWNGWGFVAIALVQTRALRPAGLPARLGQDFFLSGYRVFTRLPLASGRTLRGLKILRSDTDRRLMAAFGNLLTHYGYHRAQVRLGRTPDALDVRVVTPRRAADLQVAVQLGPAAAELPEGSPFDSWDTARRFAGPLPHTFSYEPESQSMVVVRGVRQAWRPRPVRARVLDNTFFDSACWLGSPPRLASAFYLEDVAYRWERGWREPCLNGVVRV